MTTEIISIWEFRKNIWNIWKKAQEKNIRYIIVVNSKAVMEVNPIYNNIIEDDEAETPEEHQARLEAMKDLENGDVYEVTEEQMKSFDKFYDSLKS